MAAEDQRHWDGRVGGRASETTALEARTKAAGNSGWRRTPGVPDALARAESQSETGLPRKVGDLPIGGERRRLSLAIVVRRRSPLIMQTRFSSLAVAALGAVVWSSAVRAADVDTATVMRSKLAVAQKILGGLATADFALVQTNAATLVSLSGQRGWAALQTPEYELFSTQFRLSAESVAKAAKRRDTDAMVSAYSDLTVSCVACHKYLRDSRKSSAAK